MKKIISIFFFASFVIVLSAKEYEYLVVHFQAGGYVLFPIDEWPKISFSEGTMNIETAYYQLSDLRKYTFEDSDFSGLEVPEAGNDSLAYSMEGDILYVRHGETPMPIRLYAPDGMEVRNISSVEEKGVLRVDMSGLRSGVYLLQMGTETLKFLKK